MAIATKLGASAILELYMVMLILCAAGLCCGGAMYGLVSVLDGMERNDWYKSVKRHHGATKWLLWFVWTILAILTLAVGAICWVFIVALLLTGNDGYRRPKEASWR